MQRTEWKLTATSALALAIMAFAAAGAAAQTTTIDGLHKAALAAGEREVQVYGPPTAPLRKELATAWAKRFPDITLVYSGLPGSKIVAKMKAEDRAGIHVTDAIISGTNTGVRLLKPVGLARSFEDMITVPEARDGKNWLGGELGWSDRERMVLAMLAIITPNCVVNPELVAAGEVAGDSDLLDPKWKGRIISGDPSVPGTANTVFRRLYDQHGEAFLTRLIKDQQIVFSQDLRQPVDMVAKGQYAIAIGALPLVINQFLDKGVKTIAVEQNRVWKNPSSNSAGIGGLMVPAKIPHPAATALFVNWLLSREGQTVMSRGLDYPTRRTDVDLAEVKPYLKPQPGHDYYDSYTEGYLKHPNQAKLTAFLKAQDLFR